MDEYKIEKGVPVPIQVPPNKKFPFDEMSPGDSFGLSADEHKGTRAAAYAYGKVKGQKFTVRKNGAGYRCWRVS